MTTPQAPPQFSADHQWWWTGAEWVPAAQAPPAPAPAPAPESAPVPDPLPQSLTASALIVPQFAHAEAPRKHSLKAVVAAATAVVVLAGAGAALAVGQYLGGGGQQPEDVLPSSAVAVVKLDLDPALGQKVALYQLARKFPLLKAKGTGSLKDDLLRPLFSDRNGMTYDRDVKPWLGDRAALAAVPDHSKAGFGPVAAVQFTDKGKATRTLRLAQIRAATTSPFAFAFTGDYVVLASTQAAADSYAHSSSHLADNARYRDAISSLGGDQIAVAWADLTGVYAALPAALRRANPLLSRASAHPTGAYVVGLHASSHYLELQGKGIDTTPGLSSGVATTASSNLMATFPTNTAAALEVTGLGAAAAKALSSLPAQLGVAAAAAKAGLHLPGDLVNLLGDDLAVGVTGDLQQGPTFVGRVRTAHAAQALAVLRRVGASRGTPPFVMAAVDGGYLIGSDADALRSATTGDLGRSPLLAEAAPDARGASAVAYLDFHALPLPRGARLQHLGALGLTVDGATGAFRVRLTVR